MRGALAVALALLSAAPAAAWVPLEDPPVTWAPEDIPVPWYLNERGSDDLSVTVMEPSVKAGFDSWTNIDCCDIRFRYMGRTSATPSRSPGMLVIGWVESGWRHDAAALGVAMVQWSGAHFTEADIEMNGEMYSWGVDGHSEADVEAVTAHEVGHVVGLGDLYDAAHSSSTMYYMTNGVEGRSLAADDMEGARTLYPGPCCQCTPGETGPCVTASCGAGVHECREDCQWAECFVPSAGAEICDGYDNDCDGATDEDVCSACVPTPEACDGVDNDCDTFVDENRACGPECEPLGEVEECDGNDQDCDGVIDDGCPCPSGTPPRRCGLASGRCREGEQRCVDGVWSACVGAILPQRELCDGEDNDCDGATDEDVCRVDDGGGDDGCGCAIVAARRTVAAVVLAILGLAGFGRRRARFRPGVRPLARTEGGR